MLHKGLLLLAMSGVCFAECSQSTVHGAWANYGQSTHVPPAPPGAAPFLFASVALADVDLEGNFSGPLTVNIGGRVLNGAWGGTITVNPDCTAIIKHHVVGVTGEATLRAWILDAGEMVAMGIAAGEIGTPTGLNYWRRVSWGHAACTSHMVRGVYAVTYLGSFFIPSPGQTQPTPMPFSMIGAMAFDHEGAGSGAATISMAGSITETVFPEVSITVNGDCTATATWKNAANGSGMDQMIVLDHGNEIISMPVQSTSGAPMMIGMLTRMSMTPVPPQW